MNKKSKQIVTNNGHQKIVCINPNLVMQRHDLFTTGITYMPFGLAYFTGTLKSAGYNCQVVDAFGEKPNQFWEENNLIFRGITPKEIIDKINVKSPELPFAFFVYASNVAYHSSIINIIRELRHSFLEIKIVVLEHSQAVTAYALEKVQDELYDAGTIPPFYGFYYNDFPNNPAIAYEIWRDGEFIEVIYEADFSNYFYLGDSFHPNYRTFEYSDRNL